MKFKSDHLYEKIGSGQATPLFKEFPPILPKSQHIQTYHPEVTGTGLRQLEKQHTQQKEVTTLPCTRHVQKNTNHRRKDCNLDFVKINNFFPSKKKSKSNNNKNQENIKRIKVKSKIGRTCLQYIYLTKDLYSEYIKLSEKSIRKTNQPNQNGPIS